MQFADTNIANTYVVYTRRY